MVLQPMSAIRVSIVAVWLLSPPLLAVVALRSLKRRQRPVGWKATWPLVTAVAVLANWLLFIAFILTGQIGGFGFALHDHETRRHVPARLPPSPDGIVSRLCGQMAVVLGQLPHVGTVDGQ